MGTPHLRYDAEYQLSLGNSSLHGCFHLCTSRTLLFHLKHIDGTLVSATMGAQNYHSSSNAPQGPPPSYSPTPSFQSQPQQRPPPQQFQKASGKPFDDYAPPPGPPPSYTASQPQNIPGPALSPQNSLSPQTSYHQHQQQQPRFGRAPSPNPYSNNNNTLFPPQNSNIYASSYPPQGQSGFMHQHQQHPIQNKRAAKAEYRYEKKLAKLEYRGRDSPHKVDRLERKFERKMAKAERHW